MNGILLLVAIAAAMALSQWRDRRRIRAALDELGQRVASIRWLPFGQFATARHRRTFVYEVVSEGPDGRHWRSRVACPVLDDLEFLVREEIPPHDSASPNAPRSSLRPAAIAAVACLATAGVPYWRVPYAQLELPTSLIGPGLLVTALAAGILHWLHPLRWRLTLAATAGAVVAVVVLRIALDVARDPTTHNLFPFELLLAALVGTAAAGIGIAASALCRLGSGRATRR